MGEDRRTDATEQCSSDAEGDPDPGEHQHQPDVAGTSDRIDMHEAEQQALHDDHGDEGQPAQEPAHHDTSEHHLLDDRSGDHRGDDE
jgi:hypothetical protein